MSEYHTVDVAKPRDEEVKPKSETPVPNRSGAWTDDPKGCPGVKEEAAENPKVGDKRMRRMDWLSEDLRPKGREDKREGKKSSPQDQPIQGLEGLWGGGGKKINGERKTF